MVTVPSLPQKMTFIQRKINDKCHLQVTICHLLSPFSPHSCFSLASQGLNLHWSEVADQPLSSEVINIEGHFLNGSIVGLGVDVWKNHLVFFCHHIYSHTLIAKLSSLLILWI